MSALNPPRKISRKQDLREDAVVTTYARAYGYAYENRNLLIGIGVGILVLILAIVGWFMYRAAQAEEAADLLGAALPAYEAGNYQQALDGTTATPGLLTIAREYGGSDAGNLAAFYAADAFFRLGDYEQALPLFRAVDKEENLLGASALAGEAAALESLGQLEEAGDRYRRAAGLFEDETNAPLYLLNAGRAYEAAGAYDEALEAYTELEELYPESTAAANVDVYLARARAKVGA